MSVDQARTIDILSRGPDGVCNLTISDHLEWDDRNEHLLVLQEKLNTYLAFVESGELVKTMPKYTNTPVVILVVFKYAPSQDGLRFLENAKGIVEGAGLGFKYRVGLEGRT